MAKDSKNHLQNVIKNASSGKSGCGLGDFGVLAFSLSCMLGWGFIILVLVFKSLFLVNFSLKSAFWS